jgi:hypothetical protein
MRPERGPTPGGGPGAGHERVDDAGSLRAYHPVGTGPANLFGEPVLPPAQPVATSIKSAEDIKVHAETLRARVLEAIERWGPITDEAGAERSGVGPNTWRPRRWELEKAGLVVADGIGRTVAGRAATLWRVADRRPTRAVDGPDWSELASRRPGWMGRRAFDDLVAKAMAASNGDAQAARRRVARDLEALS